MKKWTGFAAAGLLLSSAAAANAQQRVTVVGCPAAGAEPNCLLVRGADNVTYNISGANPVPAVGQRAIRVTGIPTRRTSYCRQGVVLANISWTYTDQNCR